MRSDCNFNYKELEYKSLIFNAGNMNDTISKYILNRIFSSEGKLNIKSNVKCNIYYSKDLYHRWIIYEKGY